jgi:hypothetical protein
MSRSRKHRRPSTQPYRSIASQMTPKYDAAVRDAADAELRGDAATALARHRSVPMFARSAHGDRLHQLAELGDDVPGWLVSRWLTVQVQRPLWTGADVHAPNRAARIAVPLLYPHGIPFREIGCEFVEQVLPFIVARDWVVRQLAVFELGGLRRLADLHAAPELVARAGSIDDWCRAPMGGYRLEATTDDGVLRVADVATGEAHELVDRGLAEQVPAGACVLGRVVPTTERPGRMFEWRPLPVNERTARAVARNPQRWLMILAAGARARRLPPAVSHVSETSMTADLPVQS